MVRHITVPFACRVRALIAVLAALVMAFGLAGCSSDSDAETTAESPSTTVSDIAKIAEKGRLLSDVEDELKQAGFDNDDYDVKSDTGKMVLLASNWVVESVTDGDDKPVINVRKESDVKAEEEAKKKEEEAAKQKAEEEAKKKAEEEAAKKAAEEQAAQQKAAQEKAAQEEAARKAAEEQARQQQLQQQQQQQQSNVYYQNCTAAREAGAAPLYRGQPGYSSKLDRDGDGIACE
ncbi:excalibur calcium-binding domain-containing protein [Bifidobacterium leontopitheci]|uniref:Calcium-binding protein n=1 Tax=Bifidobacterium leontopitheci TaxID=2650774 RepID=A0A6I1GY08_9BIFI|nr:calcium-binding protein [Bifidobacterium leontopitheci]